MFDAYAQEALSNFEAHSGKEGIPAVFLMYAMQNVTSFVLEEIQIPPISRSFSRC
jgi:hypothetical protein